MIGPELRAHIVRLYTVEKWRVHTIARQLGLHHATVERVLRDQNTTVRPEAKRPEAKRPCLADPFVPFMQETMRRYPGLTAARLYQMVRERGYATPQACALALQAAVMMDGLPISSE